MVSRYSKILVTGGAGFIGSHIVDELLNNGFEVRVLDNMSTGQVKNILHNQSKKEFEFVKGNIRDRHIVKTAMQDVDVVFHEAALISVTDSIKDPVLTNEVNVSGTLNLLKEAVDSGVKRFVFASSAAVYGESQNPEKNESEDSNPKNPYGVSKLADEKYARSFYQVYGLETVGLRYFNAYGPRQSCDLQAQYGGVIVIFLNRLIRNLSPIVYGDGEQTRDFVHVQDIVQANLLAMKSKNAVGEVFNVGSGTSISVNQVAEALKNSLKKNHIQNTYVDLRPGDVKHGFANIEKAKKLLNYVPKHSFEQGVTDLVTWYIKHQQLST